MKHLQFEECKTDEDLSWYFITKAPDAEMIIAAPLVVKWFPKLGTIVFVDEEYPEGFDNRAAAIGAARNIHNQHSIILNLKPVYDSSKKYRRRNKRVFKSTYEQRCYGITKI